MGAGEYLPPAPNSLSRDSLYNFKTSTIHPTVQIKIGAVIGKVVTIGPYFIIGGNVSFGDGRDLLRVSMSPAKPQSAREQ